MRASSPGWAGLPAQAAGGYGSSPGYGSPQSHSSPQDYDPGPGYAAGQGSSRGYASARDHALRWDDRSVPGYPPSDSDQPARGRPRLYAVPHDASAAGPAAWRPDRGSAARFAGRPVPGPAGRAGRDVWDSGSQWPSGQEPAGQVLTVAVDQAAEITREAWNQAAAIRQAAEQEAAAIRKQATSQAAAIREAAEREAAELKAALLDMSGELGRVAAYVTDNLTAPMLPGTRPAALPAPAEACAPPGPS
jgi:hypothetical protein